MANTDSPRLESWLRSILQECAREWPLGASDGSAFDNWLAEPEVGRVADGIPARVDRLRALGNALVPQIPETLGWAIIGAFDERNDTASG